MLMTITNIVSIIDADNSSNDGNGNDDDDEHCANTVCCAIKLSALPSRSAQVASSQESSKAPNAKIE